MSITEWIEKLSPLVDRLKSAKCADEIVEILDEQPCVGEFLASNQFLQTYTQGLKPECARIIKSILAIGQGPVVFGSLEQLSEPFESLRLFVKEMIPVETFYEPIGGIVGYHLEVLKLIVLEEKSLDNVSYRKPEGVDVEEETSEVLRLIRSGIESLPKMGEIYPVGGAGDRLNLNHDVTKESLPAAHLMFLGRTLLEGLIRDLQAREYLYEKLFEIPILTPIVMMTSHEKHNHERVQKICEDNQWFGRSKESFFFITQPLVPVITKTGMWVIRSPLELMTKPGGHGAIWKLALDSGAIDWLEKNGRTHALVRQINNPIAGTDSGLLSFTGVGFDQKKAFGFASCSRRLNTPEGMVVLVEADSRYHIANIEYTDFALHGIEDIPEKEGSSYSAFPANTNILFVDLETIKEAAQKNPIPGVIINMKTKVPGTDDVCGRLESMMQSVAEEIVDDSPDNLRTYLTYNKREKTISVTKHAYIPGKSLEGTPEGAFEELLLNARELLTKECQMTVSEDFIFTYHPALGPLYSIIRQKIQGGSLAQGSEMQLEIAELEMKECQIEGSLLIQAESFKKGKCVLRGVRVKNQGIDWKGDNCYWKNKIGRDQSLKITLRGESEFIAENVTIEGSHAIEVPHGHRTVAHAVDGRVHFRTEKIALPSWQWAYQFDDENRMILSKEQIGDCSPIC